MMNHGKRGAKHPEAAGRKTEEKHRNRSAVQEWEEASPDDLESNTTSPDVDEDRGDESPDDFEELIREEGR